MAEMCTCAEPDLAELAWAAGLFDGEGTTLAKSDSARPGYHQLVVTVPQLGREGVPEVLVRFQRAVLGMGVIERADGGSIFRWRARGFVDAQATIALLWHFLDGVKRTQAAAAMRTVGRQYAAPSTLRRRPPRSPAARRAHVPHVHPRASTRVDDLEHAWAAGFFDGEAGPGVSGVHDATGHLVGTACELRSIKTGRTARYPLCLSDFSVRSTALDASTRRGSPALSSGSQRICRRSRGFSVTSGPGSERSSSRRLKWRSTHSMPKCGSRAQRSAVCGAMSTPASGRGEAARGASAGHATASAIARSGLQPVSRRDSSRTSRAATIRSQRGVA